ncbi:hypothetical protein GBAR_LOCUS8551 [Geodia barretti]|uniref:Uncharacterized protein n=1 Tax=Geodia barretti TaxID=519541 RepID=A0AA35RMJ9_GEOBA|nr:hypothetical protein GBAR_LOCUS8551 [Geodia barretti]
MMHVLSSFSRATRMRTTAKMSSSVEKRKRRESASCGTTISYQYPSGGVEEILRPTLVVSGGRSYRKLTDVEFGRRGREEVERPRDWSLQMGLWRRRRRRQCIEMMCMMRGRTWRLRWTE